MTKSEEYFKRMLELHADQFAEFDKIHQLYLLNAETNQKEFNRIGADTMDIIREWENKLCSHSENSQFGKFSTSLADKFWELIRKKYSKIDFVGYIKA